MWPRLRKALHGERLASDCPVCARRMFVAFHDERRCVKGHVRFYQTVPRVRLRLGV